jgi:hypothetical protein
MMCRQKGYYQYCWLELPLGYFLWTCFCRGWSIRCVQIQAEGKTTPDFSVSFLPFDLYMQAVTCRTTCRTWFASCCYCNNNTFVTDIFRHHFARVTWIRRSVPSWLSTCLWITKKGQTSIRSCTQMIFEAALLFWSSIEGARNISLVLLHHWTWVLQIGQLGSKIHGLCEEIKIYCNMYYERRCAPLVTTLDEQHRGWIPYRSFSSTWLPLVFLQTCEFLLPRPIHFLFFFRYNGTRRIHVNTVNTVTWIKLQPARLQAAYQYSQALILLSIYVIEDITFAASARSYKSKNFV